jgi:hypothetical protein
MSEPIILAQAAPQIAVPLPVPSSLPKALSPSAGSKPIQPAANQTTASVGASPREMKSDDILDRMGAGALADVAVMTILTLVVGGILSGSLLMLFRKAFFSLEDLRKRWSDSEAAWMDLIRRKERGLALVAGLERQIAAVQKDLGR